MADTECLLFFIAGVQLIVVKANRTAVNPATPKMYFLIELGLNLGILFKYFLMIVVQIYAIMYNQMTNI